MPEQNPYLGNVNPQVGMVQPLRVTEEGSPFRYLSGTSSYTDYDPVTNTVQGQVGGIAGMQDLGRISVSELRAQDPGFDSYYSQFTQGGAAQPQGTTPATQTQGNVGNWYDTAMGTAQTNQPGDSKLPYWMAGLGGLLSGNIGDMLGTAGSYYTGQQGIQNAYNMGRQSLQMLGQLGQEAQTASEFRPFTVTGSMANVATDPTGGFRINLSPEEQALQNSLLASAGGFFDQARQDPSIAQSEIYESIRATQLPEEERQRQAVQDLALSQGRRGLQSSTFGGTSSELLAQEQARQEAMARASLSARQTALGEQQQALQAGGLLLGQAYAPQQRALELLSGADVTGQTAARGQQQGASLLAQLGQSGIEGLLEGSRQANVLEQIQQQGLLGALTGSQPSLQEMLIAQQLGIDPSTLGSSGMLGALGMGEGSTPDWIKAIEDNFGSLWGANTGSSMFGTPSASSQASLNLLNKDSDGDGTIDVLDEFPNDPTKI